MRGRQYSCLTFNKTGAGRYDCKYMEKKRKRHTIIGKMKGYQQEKDT